MIFLFENIKIAVGKAFEIRPGELRKAMLMQLNIFLIINALLIVKPTVNSLFLVKFGVESLPLAYLMVAVFAVIISNLYTRVISQRQLLPILIGTYGSSIVVLTGMGTLYAFDLLGGLILWLFYLWVAMFALISTSQFWIFSNMVFDVRQAKRLFGFIGSGAIAGGIVGGYMTTIFASLIGAESLPFIAALLLLLCIPITKSVWHWEVRTRKSWPVEHPVSLPHTKKAKHPFRIISQSKHLMLLTGVVGLSVLIAKLVDYQYSAVAAAAYHDPDELAAFFGFWFSTMNIVSLLIQLFVTRHVVGVLGSGTSLIFLPLGILGGAIAFIVSPHLWSSLLMKVSDGSLKQSIHKAAVELMALPIPLSIRNRTKSFIDVIVDSIATGFSGLLLIFVVRGLDLPMEFVVGIIAVICGIWIWLTFQMRKTYLKTFREKITHPDGENEIIIRNDSVLGGLERILEQGEEQQIIFVLKRTRDLKETRFLPSLRALLDHPSPAIRKEAFLNLYYLKDQKVLKKAQEMVNDPDRIVRTRALEYVFAHSQKDHTSTFTDYLKSDDPAIQRAAIVGLARETRNNLYLQNIYNLEYYIEGLYASYRKQESETSLSKSLHLEEVEIRTSLFNAIGFGNLINWFPVLEDALNNPKPEIIADAMRGIGKTLDPRFLPSLLEKLDNKVLEPFTIPAISGYGNGYVEWLQARISKGLVSIPVLRKVPLLLRETPVQNSVELLLNLYSYKDRTIRHESIKALNQLRLNYPYLKFKRRVIMERIMQEASEYRHILAAIYAQSKSEPSNSRSEEKNRPKVVEARNNLIKIVEYNLDQRLERIFRLLGLRYSAKDINPIYRGLQSESPEQRNDALEFLDNLLEPGLKRILMPIAEHPSLEHISSEALEKLAIPVNDDFESLDLLLYTEDSRVKLAVVYLISQLNDPKYIDLLNRLIEEDNSALSKVVSETLEELEAINSI